jgi:hypothetical protein
MAPPKSPVASHRAPQHGGQANGQTTSSAANRKRSPTATHRAGRATSDAGDEVTPRPANGHGSHNNNNTQAQQNSAPTRDFDAAAAQHRHDDVISQILTLEEEVVVRHRANLDDGMETMREEFDELNQVDQPNSSVDTYVGNMRRILARKVSTLLAFQARINELHELLEEEERLSAMMHAA